MRYCVIGAPWWFGEGRPLSRLPRAAGRLKYCIYAGPTPVDIHSGPMQAVAPLQGPVPKQAMPVGYFKNIGMPATSAMRGR